MRDLTMSVMYVFCLSWKMWDCVQLEDGTYVLESEPSVVCFDSSENEKWPSFATLSFFLLLFYCSYPAILFIDLKENLGNEKRVGFMYLKYNDENWYWDPVMEMSKK